MQPWQYVLRFEIREFLTFLLEIKRKRNSRFSQRAFAGYIGLSPSTLNEILSGKRQITKISLLKITEAIEQDRGFDEYLAEYLAQRPLDSVIRNLESNKKAFQSLIGASEVARQKGLTGPFFCTLIVAAHQEDCDLLRSKILKSLEEDCQTEDIFEVSFGAV
jgi:transcriptional regulator with XRE-family HTH domain